MVKNQKGGYSSIGRATVCGTVGSLFKSGYPPFFVGKKNKDIKTKKPGWFNWLKH